jgi:SAM-dependent methyltransferase
VNSSPFPFSKGFTDYTRLRRLHWDSVAAWLDSHGRYSRCYHSRLESVYQHLVPPGSKILEIGCGLGDLLAALKPSIGVGIDISQEMVRRASQRHPECNFIQADAHFPCFQGAFDVIILSDLLNDLWDVQLTLARIHPLCDIHTRVIINTYSRLWEMPLAFVERLGLAKPNLYQNWLTVGDLANLLSLTGFEAIRHWTEILVPIPIPFLTKFANKYVCRFWPFDQLCLTNFILARPICPRFPENEPSVSVVIPARNEAGNITQIFERLPDMGSRTELIFVEGHSVDDTYRVIEQCAQKYFYRKCKIIQQTGKGKGDAVRLGFSHAEGDILMILDADLSVQPEDLPRFYEALTANKSDFVNGVRLVYPMEEEAMRFFNLLGNKLFSMAFSWLLGQDIKDTLCGTKVLWKADYEKISANRSNFGDFDPFGDFDLIFGAAKLGLKIVDLPVRYKSRTYGKTNIQRWKHGWLLFKMMVIAVRRLKFV